MSTITAQSTGGAWNSNSTWVGSVQPTAADDVIIPSTPVTPVSIATGTTALCRSLTIQSGGKLTFNSSTSVLQIGDGSGGALSIDAGATLTLTGIGTINFAATADNGGAGWPVTTGGKTMPNLTFNGAGGKWQLQDAVTAGATATLTLTAGTLAGNGKAVTVGEVNSNVSTTRALTTGTATWTITGTSGNVWNFATTTGLTLNTAGATLNFTGNGGVSLSLGALDYGGANFGFGPGASAVYTLGGLSWSNLGTVTVTGPASVLLAATGGTGRTVARLLLNGTSGNVVTFGSSTGGSVAGIKLGAAASTATYATITDITANPGASLDATGAGNTNGGNNHNVVFKTPARLALAGVG